MSTHTKPITNALTVDLEDWTQSVLGPSTPITDCVVGNTERVLALLDRHRVRATFFALGKVCERFPHLLGSIASAGHEIASHGYGHELLFDLTPDEFREDLERSVDIIGSQIGRAPLGYRAPAFSITKRSLWAPPILAEMGFGYSSSVFPIDGRRYGIVDAPRAPHRWDSCDLIEFPMTTLRRWGRNIPVAGGGYLRLLPASIHAAALAEMNAAGHPGVVYLHPYELAVDELGLLRRRGWRLRWQTRLTQSLFRGCVEGRLSSMLRRFSFAPMADVLGLTPPAPATATRATVGRPRGVSVAH